MSKLRVYEYDKCSTCRKALAFLDSRKVAYEKIPIVEQPPGLPELKRMLQAQGGELRRLFNTSGLLYRELGIGEKLKTLSEAQALELLAKHGKLVKRPFVLAKDRALLGFKQAEWERAFA